jgi:hypothetical protein
LNKYQKDIKLSLDQFHQGSRTSLLCAFRATEQDLVDKLADCPKRFFDDAHVFLNSSMRPEGLTKHDNHLVFEIAKVGLYTELINNSRINIVSDSRANTTPFRLASPILSYAQPTDLISSATALLQARQARRSEFAKNKRREEQQSRETLCAQFQQVEEITAQSTVCFHNISHTILTASETKLLNNGLKFILTPHCVHDAQYVRAFDRLARSIRLRYHFITSPTDTNPNKLFVPNPKYMPPQASNIIEKYISMCRTDLLNLLERFPTHYTSDSERRHVKRIADKLREKQLVIKPADKNLGPVVMNAAQYNKLCLDILLDADTYKIVTDPPSVHTQLSSLADILKNKNISVTSNLAKYLLQGLHNGKTKSTAKFYILPKMHKIPIVGRPIVSNINYTSYHVSKWLHQSLEPLLKNFPSYLKDSKEVILDLEELQVPGYCILATADVTSLYPSIPTHLGLHALRSVLSTETEWPAEKIDLILELSSWVLQNMYLSFDGISYLQTKGTAMGTPFAVVYAIIYLHFHESSVVNKLSFKPIYFKRFIDDILLIFRSKEQAKKFLDTYNDIDSNIILTSNIGTSVDFLDITVFKGPRLCALNKLDFKTFQKAQNKYLYIPPTSYHDRRVFMNLISSELKRYCLTCTIPSDFDSLKLAFFDRLKIRGYTAALINEPCRNLMLDRNHMLAELRLSRQEIMTEAISKPETFRFIIQHNPRDIPFKEEKWGSLPEFVFQDQFCHLLFDTERPIMFVKKNPPPLSVLLC